MFVDARQITGVSAWLKPFKFFVSLGIYSLSIAWLGGMLIDADKALRIISWATVGMVVIEMSFIVLQAVRGIPSHFNVTSAFNGTVYSIMGGTITISTCFLLWFGYLFFTNSAQQIPPAFLWGIRLGILFTVIGGMQGFVMGANMAHTVGAPDGGAGLPILNWSTSHGDLRIAHAIGLHSLQVLPLAGFMISQYVSPAASWLTLLASVGYGGVFAWVLVNALKGKALFS